MKMNRVWSALALAALVAGCSKSEPAGGTSAPTPVSAAAKNAPAPAAANAAPDVYVQGLLKAVGNGDAAVLWNALPAKYQADVVGLKSEFASKMDADLWNKGFSVAGKLASLLKDKKAMLLASPLAAQIPPPFKPMVESNWDAVSNSLSAVVSSEIKTLEGLKSADVGKFLGSTGNVIVGGAMKAAMAASPDDAAKFQNTKVVLVKEEGDTATLRFEVPGSTEPAEEKKAKKVDGKWLPAELVDGWDKTMADAKTEMAGITVTPEMKAQFNGAMGMVEPILDKLLAAKDQAAFDGEVQGLLAVAMMLGGGPPGGAMSGPPGGAPAGLPTAPGGLPGGVPGTLPGGVTIPPPGPGGLPTLPPSTTPVAPPTVPPAPKP